MIKRVTIKNFKLFEQVEIDLGNIVLLAGPNNSGKSTVLQAIAVFQIALQKWLLERGADSTAKVRPGIAMTRQEFTALPLREMNLIWNEKRTALGRPEPGKPRSIEIEIFGEDQNKPEWSAGVQIQYAGPEMVYIKPLRAVPTIVQSLKIVHVPPFSGIESSEPRRDIGYQNILIGQGRPGEILRNLLWEIYKDAPQSWKQLSDNIAALFGYKLIEPRYAEGQAYIVCEYQAGLPEAGRKKVLPKLDIANAGSGFHQVLLLLAFFYGRPASVLLLDEPDAHLHFILQKEIFDLLEKVAAQRNCQLIVATHSEALLDDHEPSEIISFIGKQPRILSIAIERDQIREALKKISTIELLKAQQKGAVLYVESDSDYKILREWAHILKHDSAKFLEQPFIHPLGGRSLHEAKEHFFALKACYPSIKGLCILDGDNRDLPDEEIDRLGLRVLRWQRYEIENYLIHPEAIKRYVNLPLIADKIIDDFFATQFPTNIDLFGTHPALERVKASEEYLIPLLSKTLRPTPKKHLYLIANIMKANEIHPEVKNKLDAISNLGDEIHEP